MGGDDKIAVVMWSRERRVTEGEMMAQGNEDGSGGRGEECSQAMIQSIDLNFLMICLVTSKHGLRT